MEFPTDVHNRTAYITYIRAVLKDRVGEVANGELPDRITIDGEELVTFPVWAEVGYATKRVFRLDKHQIHTTDLFAFLMLVNANAP